MLLLASIRAGRVDPSQLQEAALMTGYRSTHCLTERTTIYISQHLVAFVVLKDRNNMYTCLSRLSIYNQPYPWLFFLVSADSAQVQLTLTGKDCNESKSDHYDLRASNAPLLLYTYWPTIHLL